MNDHRARIFVAVADFLEAEAQESEVWNRDLSAAVFVRLGGDLLAPPRDPDGGRWHLGRLSIDVDVPMPGRLARDIIASLRDRAREFEDAAQHRQGTV